MVGRNVPNLLDRESAGRSHALLTVYYLNGVNGPNAQAHVEEGPSIAIAASKLKLKMAEQVAAT